MIRFRISALIGTLSGNWYGLLSLIGCHALLVSTCLVSRSDAMFRQFLSDSLANELSFRHVEVGGNEFL